MEGSADDHGRWSSTIPLEILELILKRLICCMADCIRFGAVCKLWRSMLLEKRHLLSSNIHLLLLPEEEEEKEEEEEEEDDDSRDNELLDITTDRFYKLSSLPKALTKETTFFGFSSGWLLTMNYSNYQIQLLNPITRAQISLPPATTFDNFDDQDCGSPHHYKYFAMKAVLSSDPNSNDGDCLIMAIHGYKRELGFCKVGDQRWTSIESNLDQQYLDVAFYKGRFYAVTQRGIVVAPDLGPDLTVKVIAQPRTYGCCKLKYLVKSCDELLVVTRYFKRKYIYDDDHATDDDDDDTTSDDDDDDDDHDDNNNNYGDNNSDDDDYATSDDDDDHNDNNNNYGDDNSEADDDDNHNFVRCEYKTRKFAIHRVDLGTGEWEEVTSLGDRMFFIGKSGSISISVNDMPGCKPNHIYFADDFFEPFMHTGHDIGAYSLEDNCVRPFSSSTRVWPLSMSWVTLAPW